ncbi:MAG: DUF4367 domain-containing protein [Oscillospiraceae bacterium]|nr:DUF4367 domain-containing protein [Oscillospiraceae bacterium]
MEEKYLQKMYEEIFYRSAALSSAELDLAAAARAAASPNYTPYSKRRYKEGLATLKKRYAKFMKAQRKAARQAAKEAEAQKRALAVQQTGAASPAQASSSSAPAVQPAAPSAAAYTEAPPALPAAACGTQPRLRASNLRWFKKPLRYLTAGVLATMMLSTAVMAAGGIFDRSQITDHGEYGVIRLDSGVLQSCPEGWENTCYPTWVPQGFELVRTMEDSGTSQIVYQKGNDQFLSIDVLSPDYNTTPSILNTINTENCDPVDVRIQGNPCTVYVRRDCYYALCYFSYESAGYLISGNVSPDDIVQVAEKLSIFSH